MPYTRIFFSVTGALLLACGSEPRRAPKPPDTFTAFPNLPLPPAAQFVSRAGSEDALQLRLLSAGTPDQVTEYYRNALTKGKWRLVSDTKRPNGTVVLYAEQDGPPIWVTISPTSDGAGTMVELTGAVVGNKRDSLTGKRDSTKAGK